MVKSIFFSLIISSNLCCVEWNYISQENQQYENSLIKILDKFDKFRYITDQDLIVLIPKTQFQYNLYYTLSLPEKGKKWNLLFNKIEVFLGKRVSENRKVFRAYLFMAQFVDGEYAEGYFESLDFYMKKHGNYFCSIFGGFSIKEKKVLKELHAQYCE